MYLGLGRIISDPCRIAGRFDYWLLVASAADDIIDILVAVDFFLQTLTIRGIQKKITQTSFAFACYILCYCR
jgi:hypothetical protein